jgi:trans-aconitate methyltransferase
MTASSSPLSGPGGEPVEIDTSVAHMSRAYDYLLGGTTNFPADRAMIEQAADAYGGLERARGDARANRDFLVRAVRWLASEAGMRQFLDLGTGVPNDDNVHAVAQGIAPEARVVYVDHDPIVLAHAHELLKDVTSMTSYIAADIRDPEGILEQAGETLDFSQPVALTMVAILHALPDEDDPYGIARRLLDALPSGSYLAVSHLASDIEPEASAEFLRRMNEDSFETYQFRSRDEVARFFEGLELIEPGIERLDRWRTTAAPGADEIILWGGVGRKP